MSNNSSLKSDEKQRFFVLARFSAEMDSSNAELLEMHMYVKGKKKEAPAI
jgi:hypothetical protein